MDYFSRKKIEKHLKSKPESGFTFADRLLKMHLSGEVLPILKGYGFEDIEIFPDIGKRGCDFQIGFKYAAIFCGIDFFDDRWSYVWQPLTDPDSEPEESEEMPYPDGADLKTLLDDMVLKLKHFGKKG